MSGGVWAIVPAAGRGTRVGTSIPKQYLQLAGKSIIEHTLDVLLSHPMIQGAMVAIAVDDVDWPATLESMHGKPIRTCIGGSTRAQSVLNALHAAECDIAVVHDAARPLLCADDISSVIEKALEFPRQGAILASPVADTIKRAMPDGAIEWTVNREKLWRALTPQVFDRVLLIESIEAAMDADAVITDEASALENVGLHPLLVEGRADNLKITTQADLAIAEALLRERFASMRMDS